MTQNNNKVRRNNNTMIEINIYTKFNYRVMKRNLNKEFGEKNKIFVKKPVFCFDDNTISLRKNNIRICYSDIKSKYGNSSKRRIQDFIENNFSHQTIGVKTSRKCDIFDKLLSIKTIQIQ